MPGVTLIFTAFDRNFVLSLGGEIQKEETEHEHEVVIVESQGRVSQPVGFAPNDDEEWEDDEDEGSRSKPLHHRILV